MITEGIITSIDYTSNVCFVRLPIFENVSSDSPVIIEGRLAVQPGSYNGYKVNDSVWVGFVDNKLGQPLVIGKIYQGPKVAIKDIGGYFNIAGLDVSGTEVSLPKETKISNSQDSWDLEKIINKIKDLQIELNQKDNIIRELQQDLNAILGVLGNNVTDSEGNLLMDKDNELLQYKGETK